MPFPMHKHINSLTYVDGSNSIASTKPLSTKNMREAKLSCTHDCVPAAFLILSLRNVSSSKHVCGPLLSSWD